MYPGRGRRGDRARGEKTCLKQHLELWLFADQEPTGLSGRRERSMTSPSLSGATRGGPWSPLFPGGPPETFEQWSN